MAKVEFVPLPKQYEFMTSQADEVLYSGAYGAGKTRALAGWALQRAIHPYARVGLFRMKLQDLLNTTLMTLLEGDGDLPPLLPKGSYHHNQQRRIIRLDGGGLIIYDQLDDVERLASLNLSDAGIEEASETVEEHWEKLGKRCRVKVPGRENQLVGVCNPAAPSHYLAKRFGIQKATFHPELAFKGDEKSPLTMHAVMTNAFENPYLPERYRVRLRGMTGVMYKRYALGEWAGSEGAVFDRWDRSLHVKPRVGPWAHTFVGVDDGTTNPFASLLVREDADGRMHVENETYRRQMSEQEKVDAVTQLGVAEVVVVDPAAAGLKQALRRADFRVSDANNNVLTGIAEVQSRLVLGSDGAARLTVDPSCVNLIREMESYEWEPDRPKDTPIKSNDHAVDALRYVAMLRRADSAAAFDPETLKLLRSQCRKPTTTGALDSRDGWDIDLEAKVKDHDASCVEFTPGDGPWQVWCALDEDQAPSCDHPYIVAVSVGSGLAGSPTVIKVGDAETRHVVAEAVLEGVTPERAARVACLAGMWFDGPSGRARLIWKSGTGVGAGESFGETVRRLGYGRVYRHHQKGQALDKPGWQWTREGIHTLFGELRNALAAGRYVERSSATADDAMRWAFNAQGVLAPAGSDADGQTVQTATDRAMAAMLLSHAFGWGGAVKTSGPKAMYGSVAWEEARDKREKEKRRGGRRERV